MEASITESAVLPILSEEVFHTRPLQNCIAHHLCSGFCLLPHRCFDLSHHLYRQIGIIVQLHLQLTDMPESALIGEEPIGQDDKLIHKALSELSPAILKLSKAARAHHAPYQTRAPSMITGSSFALLLLLVITTARLWVRGHRSRAFGADDYAIIPGALGCMAYLSLVIAQETAGCLGKNIYHCTYQEFRWFYEVCYVFAHCM